MLVMTAVYSLLIILPTDYWLNTTGSVDFAYFVVLICCHVILVRIFVPRIAAYRDEVSELASACRRLYCSGLLQIVRREE